jgi:WD40 repeat protein
LVLFSNEGVSWYQPSEEENLLLSSAGEDGSICIWKYNDLSLVFEQNAHQVIFVKHIVKLQILILHFFF